MHALLLVDLQHDFLPGGALAVPDGDAVIPVALNAIATAQRDGALVVATQDWHPADHRSFASQHPGHAVGDVIDLDGVDQILWPDHCVQHTSGAAFAPSLDASAFDLVVQKGTDRNVDSYSGFHDNRRGADTGLAAALRERGVTDLLVMGLATDYCVRFTALDAVTAGFRTTLLRPGCRGVELTPGDCAAALDAMHADGVEIVEEPAFG